MHAVQNVKAKGVESSSDWKAPIMMVSRNKPQMAKAAASLRLQSASAQYKFLANHHQKGLNADEPGTNEYLHVNGVGLGFKGVFYADLMTGFASSAW
jgi:hypothetical protein